MVDYHENQFNEEFFIYYEHFERVSSGDHRALSFSLSSDTQFCPLCSKQFSIISFKHNCSNCGMCFCSDCVHKCKGGKEKCLSCYALDNKCQKFSSDLKNLENYKNAKLPENFKGALPLQVGVLFFLDFLNAKEHQSIEYPILSLYRYKRVFSSNQVAQVVLHDLYELIISSYDKEYKALDVAIDLFSDISLYQRKELKHYSFGVEVLDALLKTQNPNLAAAAARLCLILVQERILDPDIAQLIELINKGNMQTIAFASAALASKFPLPTLFEDSKPSILQYNDQNLSNLTKYILGLFDHKPQSSIAAQYFGSIVLLKISESENGCLELTKYLPLQNLINSLCLFCPRQLGLSRNEGNIAVYLSRMVKNLWRYCEKSSNKDKLINHFFSSVLGFIFDVTERRLGYDTFSHVCIIQTIALDLADDIGNLEQFKAALSNPLFQKRFQEMKNERRSNNDILNQEKIDSLSNQVEELTKEQILLIREREKENIRIRQELIDMQLMIHSKDFENQKLKRNLDVANANAQSAQQQSSSTQSAFLEKENEINQLKSEIDSKNNEISALKNIIEGKQKDDEILNHIKIEEEKQRIIDEKQKEIEEKKRTIEIKDTDLLSKQKVINEKIQIITELEEKIEHDSQELEARNAEISRLNQVVKEKEEKIEEYNNGFTRIPQSNNSEIDSIKKQMEQKDKELRAYASKFANLASDWANAAEILARDDEDINIEELVQMPVVV